MSHVHADRHGRRGALGRRMATLFVATTLSAGLIAPLAAADTLSDLKAAQQANSAQQDVARNAISQAQENVNSATQRLIQSQNELANAQAILSDITVQLQAAREDDARIAAELEAARQELERAKQRVAKAEADVAQQLALIGTAARESFQQQTDLRGLTVVFGSETPAELSQRLQWNTTVFDTQAAEKARLELAQVQLQASRDLQSQIESRIASDKKAAEAQVLVVADLEKKAADQKAGVETLVAQNKASLQAAQSKLAADQGALGSAQSAQASAQQELNAAQGELSESQDAYEAAVAESNQRAQAVKDAIAKQSAAQAKADGASSGGTGGSAVSASGFIRPVDASPGSPFGLRFHPILHVWRMHEGTDFGAACGAPIYAARSGTVLESRKTLYSGNYTVIGHGTINGVYVTTSYSHQSRMVVKVGQKVTRGQIIGYVGNTGLSTVCHLHLEVRHNGDAVDPMRYIP